MKAERTAFEDGSTICVSCISPPVGGEQDIVIEIHRADHRVSFLLASRKELREWVVDLAYFVEGLDKT